MTDVPSRFHANPEGSTGCVVKAREADAGMALPSTFIMRTAQCSGRAASKWYRAKYGAGSSLGGWERDA